ncbi:twin-arginine translocase TatA/TatE family subunit [Microbacterium enclense]|uniref:Sec-independent protein translocase protein TatB n=1 Tax=Microbacterium enclense TaxID=993073 RepID=A0A1G6GMP7_9MICO|nr:twin-arginine translocase TatA/TatE family subunit [Microbacterium enclense]SDB83209.1 sec-independent protein translocase protein TatB [Microbacterium enclense]
MIFGLTIEKVLVIGLLAVLIIGPERLPQAAQSLRDLVRRAKVLSSGARERVRAELGDDFDDVDWTKLDPRQYDPRRIIREALTDDSPGASPPAPTETPRRAPRPILAVDDTALDGAARAHRTDAGEADAA